MDPNYLEKGLSIPPARMHISSGGGKPPHGGVTNKPQDLDLELITQPLPNDNQENQLKQPPPAPEKKPSTAARMARGLGLKRGDRESQKSQKSNVSGERGSNSFK